MSASRPRNDGENIDLWQNYITKAIMCTLGSSILLQLAQERRKRRSDMNGSRRDPRTTIALQLLHVVVVNVRNIEENAHRRQLWIASRSVKRQ